MTGTNLTTAQRDALTTLRALKARTSRNSYVTATAAGIAPAALVSLERAGLVASRSESVNTWGERTRAAYALTAAGTSAARRI